MKKYINSAILYALLALISGVFYREFTKFNNFDGKTTLGLLHTHYFVLGMLVFLLFLLLEKNFSFTQEKTKQIILTYNVGLNLTALSFLIRGIIQVKRLPISSFINAFISGIAGIGHVLLGISILILLLQIKRSVN